MTDQQRDPAAAGPEDATDPVPEDDTAGTGIDETEMTDDGADDALEDDDLSADDEDDDDGTDEGEFDDEEAAASGPAASAATTQAGAGRRRARGTAPKGAPAPTAADDAVHIVDRVSSWFVIATVGVFVVILAWGLLLGRNGIITDALATPKPIATPVESVIPSEAPSVAPESPSAAASPAAS